jgi:hypothetical protein
MTLIASGIVAVPRFGELTFHKADLDIKGLPAKF